jgi:alkaline phosphatase
MTNWNGCPHRMNKITFALAVPLLFGVQAGTTAPTVSRLTPPSALFTFGDTNAPYISRFFLDQRFDLQATIQPDSGQTITNAGFYVDNIALAVPPIHDGCHSIRIAGQYHHIYGARL